MPVQYEGILAEHRAVREHAGLFDVSHMGQIHLRGAGALASLERLVTCPVASLRHGQVRYGLLCHESGGTVDDVTVYRSADDAFFVLLVAYHIAFVAWRGTTVGGIICQLRVVKVDGTPIRFVDPLVRGLSAIFSTVVVGLGFFWIVRDPERQAWHDRIAGTYVVRVPRNYPI